MQCTILLHESKSPSCIDSAFLGLFLPHVEASLHGVVLASCSGMGRGCSICSCYSVFIFLIEQGDGAVCYVQKQVAHHVQHFCGTLVENGHGTCDAALHSLCAHKLCLEAACPNHGIQAFICILCAPMGKPFKEALVCHLFFFFFFFKLD